MRRPERMSAAPAGGESQAKRIRAGHSREGPAEPVRSVGKPGRGGAHRTDPPPGARGEREDCKPRDGTPEGPAGGLLSIIRSLNNQTPPKELEPPAGTPMPLLPWRQASSCGATGAAAMEMNAGMVFCSRPIRCGRRCLFPHSLKRSGRPKIKNEGRSDSSRRREP